MKLFSLVFALALMISGHARESLEDVYKKAQDIVCEADADEENQLLFALYSNAIKEYSLEELGQNPELVFRKALAWFDLISEADSIEEMKMQLKTLRDDFTFVVTHAGESAMASASTIRIEMIDFVLDAAPQKIEDLSKVVNAYWDFFFRKWTDHSTSSGKALREEVMANLEKSPSLFESFKSYIVLSQSDPEVALGYLRPSEIKILGVVDHEDEEKKAGLSFMIRYFYFPNYELIIESEI